MLQKSPRAWRARIACCLTEALSGATGARPMSTRSSCGTTVARRSSGGSTMLQACCLHVGYKYDPFAEP